MNLCQSWRRWEEPAVTHLEWERKGGAGTTGAAVRVIVGSVPERGLELQTRDKGEVVSQERRWTSGGH